MDIPSYYFDEGGDAIRLRHFNHFVKGGDILNRLDVTSLLKGGWLLR